MATGNDRSNLLYVGLIVNDKISGKNKEMASVWHISLGLGALRKALLLHGSSRGAHGTKCVITLHQTGIADCLAPTALRTPQKGSPRHGLEVRSLRMGNM